MEKLKFKNLMAEINTEIAVLRAYPVLNPDRLALRSKVTKLINSLPEYGRELVDVRGIN